MTWTTGISQKTINVVCSVTDTLSTHIPKVRFPIHKGHFNLYIFSIGSFAGIEGSANTAVGGDGVVSSVRLPPNSLYDQRCLMNGRTKHQNRKKQSVPKTRTTPAQMKKISLSERPWPSIIIS